MITRLKMATSIAFKIIIRLKMRTDRGIKENSLNKNKTTKRCEKVRESAKIIIRLKMATSMALEIIIRLKMSTDRGIKENPLKMATSMDVQRI